MSFKIIAFDLDGTLLTSDKKLTETTAAALKNAADRGIVLVPATGRMFSAVPKEILELKFIRYFILINGASLYDRKENRVLYRGEISRELALRFIDYMNTLGLIYDCYMDDRAYMTGSMYDMADSVLKSAPHLLHMVKSLRQSVPELAEFIREQNKPVQKLQLFFSPEQLPMRDRLLGEIDSLFPELTASSSYPNNIEINSSLAGKGRALQALAAELDTDIKNTAALGDGLNDIEMLKTAGMGIAMENAEQSVKRIADYVTGSNDASGAAAAINMLLEGSR